MKEMSLTDLCMVKDLLASVTELESRLIAGTGLNLNQSFALCCLSRGPKTAGGLAGQLRISGPSLSRVLKRLVELGLITRAPDHADARTWVLALSAEGEKKAAELLAHEKGIFPLKVELTPPADSSFSG